MRRHGRSAISVFLSATAFLGGLALLPTASAKDKGVRVVPVVTARDSSGHSLSLYKASHALVIGISRYTAGWPNIESVPREMDEVAEVLSEQGFQVKRLDDPGAEALAGGIKRFIDEHGYEPENRLLVYFSGHGHSREGNEKGYLVPADAPRPEKDERGFLRKALTMTDIEAWARKAEAKHVLFVFDSCFSGTIFKTRALPSSPPQIVAATARPVRQFITAGSAGEAVPAKSVFTPSFVRAIRGEGDLTGDGYVTGTELGIFLTERVLHYATGQTPQFGKIRDPDLDEGDFVFVVGAALAPEVPRGSEAAKLMEEAEGRRQAREQEGQRLALLQREKEQAYQKALEEEFQRCLQLERYDDADLAPARKAEAWKAFLTGYAQRNQHEDHAKGRVRYWEDKARRQPARPAGAPPAQGAGDMVSVPAGPFQMGSNDGDSDEKPVHGVTLDAFWIDRTEVTVAAYQACVSAGMCGQPNTGGSCNWGKSDRGQHPVNCVDWNQAKAYCEWAGKRLPTEAEWEKAARGTDGRTYPWGNEKASCQYAIMNDGGNGCGKGSTWPVGSKPAAASPYGALDMAGNVWEWVSDWYGDGYYASSPSNNPKGPSSGSQRVLRGGSWNYYDDSTYLRAAPRYRYDPALRYASGGFRCARDGSP